ncbi:MAG: ExbD/TolR family protein, partial [Flavobacteriales bacterium]
TESNIEKELKIALLEVNEPTIILRAEEGVPIEDVVFVMDIANKNKYKVVLAVRPN